MDQSTLEKQIITINEKISISKRKLEDIEEDSEDYEKEKKIIDDLSNELKKRKLKLLKLKKESGVKLGSVKITPSKIDDIKKESITEELEKQTKKLEEISLKDEPKITTTKKAINIEESNIPIIEEYQQQEDIDQPIEKEIIAPHLVNTDIAREQVIKTLQPLEGKIQGPGMLPSVLERLKVKPKTQTKKEFGIVMPIPIEAPTPYISVSIVDKTKENLINRDEILNRIKNSSIVTIAKPLDVALTKKQSVVSKMSAIESAALFVPEKQISNDTFYITDIVKLKRRLKLIEISTKMQSTQIVPDEKEIELVQKIPTIPSKRITKKPEFGQLAIEIDDMIIGDTIVKERLPMKIVEPIRSSPYYMNNREKFINFINSLFLPYREELMTNKEQLTCDSAGNADFTLLTHQKIVRDYLNIYTPYRGLLLYHGLGSGKTCSSIAIAEGLKSHKPIIVMTPASLKTNYIQELMKCGDEIYKKNQYWEFIPVLTKSDPMLQTLSAILSLSISFITKNKGAWLVNIKKPSNYNELTENEKISLNSQITEMIAMKYTMLNYNGMRMSHLKRLSSDFTKNPFNNSVIIVDEAHDFVSRIVNKLNYPNSLSMRLYDYLMSAENVKIVMLSGTPIINYPNEIAIMFNILRGYIKTWHIPLQIQTQSKINKDEIARIFNKLDILDYMDYNVSSKMLTITRNPFGFVNVNEKGEYEGVTKFKVGSETGSLSDTEFEKMVITTLAARDIKINPGSIQIETFKSLPDKLDQFKAYFIDDINGAMKNVNLFQRRIIGLSSYFRSAQEQLMPRYDKTTDLRVIEVPMSDYQFTIYEEARSKEREQESRNKRKRHKAAQTGDLYEESNSTYRIFSRLYCNFVFPASIKRPLPVEGESLEQAVTNETLTEEDLDALNVNERLENPDGIHEQDDSDEIKKEMQEKIDITYSKRIMNAILKLKEGASKYLTPEALQTYSPKFLNVLENVKDASMRGLHLIYSQFRTVEGIGILQLIFDNNGLAQFKIKKNEKGEWVIDINEEDMGKPMYALYTGTEGVEEKEIIRNIYNSTWEYVPVTITEQLKRISTNNYYGEIIKVFMITASGAQGINLRNTRYVHIIEPYWHPVRIEQVIGRARRICSHQDLPEELRTVNVIMYLMSFTPKQLTEDALPDLKIYDKGKKTDKPLTSDQALFEISTIKEEINKQLLMSIKQAAIDCTIHSKSGSKEQIKCFSFGDVKSNKFSYTPSIGTEESDSSALVNTTIKELKLVEVTMNIGGVPTKFAMDKKTMEIYDYDSYKNSISTGSAPLKIGKIEMQADGKKKFIKL